MPTPPLRQAPNPPPRPVLVPEHMHHGHEGTKGFFKVAAGIFFLAAAFTLVWSQFQTPWQKSIKAEITNQPYARTITVSADGKVTSAPDIATINLSVVSDGKTVKSVTQDANEKMAKIVAAVKAQGVESKDVVTSSYDLGPQYDYTDYNNPPKFLGYRLTQTLTVKIRDLNKVDDVLDQSVTSGANQVGQLVFDIDDASIIKKDARKEAFQKAKDKAQEMADDAGVKLGRVVTFSEGSDYQPIPYANFAMDSKAMAPQAEGSTVEAGSKELTVNVSVTYEIE